MRMKVCIGIVILTLLGMFAYWPKTMTEPMTALVAIPKAREALFLRERQFGKARDDIDELVAEALAAIIEDPTPEPEPDRIYLGLYWVTGYDLCVHCCGIWSAEHPRWQGTDYVQTTASGVPNCVGVTIATGTEFAFGARLYIEGVGERTVQDRGVGNGCIDVLCHNHDECADVTGWREVWLLKGGTDNE